MISSAFSSCGISSESPQIPNISLVDNFLVPHPEENLKVGKITLLFKRLIFGIESLCRRFAPCHLKVNEA